MSRLQENVGAVWWEFDFLGLCDKMRRYGQNGTRTGGVGMSFCFVSILYVFPA